jgi:alpha-L-fucosidase
VDIVSKNGNLLLDVGPEADGTIPPVQMERLKALGQWLSQNGEAIYGTHPWKRAEGKTGDGVDVRFTEKNSTLYATILGEPSGPTVTLTSLKPKAGERIQMLGYDKPLIWSQVGEDVKVMLPSPLPGKYAYVFEIEQSGTM